MQQPAPTGWSLPDCRFRHPISRTTATHAPEHLPLGRADRVRITASRERARAHLPRSERSLTAAAATSARDQHSACRARATGDPHASRRGRSGKSHEPNLHPSAHTLPALARRKALCRTFASTPAPTCFTCNASSSRDGHIRRPDPAPQNSGNRECLPVLHRKRSQRVIHHRPRAPRDRRKPRFSRRFQGKTCNRRDTSR